MANVQWRKYGNLTKIPTLCYNLSVTGHLISEMPFFQVYINIRLLMKDV